MPTFNLIGNCYWASGFEEDVTADTEQDAKNRLRVRFAILEEGAMALGIDLQEIDVQDIVLVEGRADASAPPPAEDDVAKMLRKLASRLLSDRDNVPYDTAADALRLLKSKEGSVDA